jgi:hypothetical protein
MTSDSKCLLSPVVPPYFGSIDRCLNGNNCRLLLILFTPVAHNISGWSAMRHDRPAACLFWLAFGLLSAFAFGLLLACSWPLLLVYFWLAFGLLLAVVTGV